ncbi:phage tail spike protein [Halobacillus ihumii]|uniref:phage tail spike protein n=1 Tax=Halobacillus ihumii TaxID=2686092 RepID=UPI0013D7B5C6|nr:phage tail spike protein [Halobacillus ihumii]
MSTYGLQMINAPLIWEESNQGEGVVVAVIDTGIDTNHPDLQGKIIGGQDFTGEGSYEDTHGHGTHVAGTVAGETVGVAPKASILAYRVFNSLGNTDWQWITNAINAAVDWIGPNGEKVQVINISIGSYYTYDERHDAIKRAVDNGIVVICSAGNYGDGDATTDETGYPAVLPETISVGAVDKDKNIYTDQSSNDEVDIVGPGVDVYSTTMGGGYGYMTGTSMAAPHVAGAAALLWSMLHEPNYDDVRYGLLHHAESLGYSDNLQGNGLLNLQAYEGYAPPPDERAIGGPTHGISILDKNFDQVAILENAYDGEITRRANELWSASFSMPAVDPKNEHCDHFNYVKIHGESGRYYGLYRIMQMERQEDDDSEEIRYKCEHVLATLLSDVIYGYTQFTNMPTEYVFKNILERQTIKHWKLGKVDIKRYFHYKFEDENGLLAPIFSIPQPFDEPYIFTFDTTRYPFTLNLEKTSNDVVWDIRWGKNLIAFNETSEPSEIVNVLYPKGAGEGVNALDIRDINNGIPYLKDQVSIDEWGEHSYIWHDKRFEDKDSLKENAQSLLDQWKIPKISFTLDAADLSIREEYAHERKPFYTVGDITTKKGNVYKARIIEDTIPLDAEYDVTYKIENKLDDIATTQADLERKQQVNEAYSQGSTNIDSHDYQDNCDPNNPATIRFFLPNDLVNINTLDLSFETEAFRAYAQATEGGGAIIKSTASGGSTTRTTTSGGSVSKSTESGGGSVQTSSSGGGVSKSTESGGGSVQSSDNGGSHRHTIASIGSGTNYPPPDNYNLFDVYVEGVGFTSLYLPSSTPGAFSTYSADGDHSHSVSIPNHSHSFNTPNHSHDVNIPSHSHDFTVPSHSHEVSIPEHTHQLELPDHTHDVKHGIYKLQDRPSEVEIRVDGNLMPTTGASGNMIDLIPYLSKDSGGKVQRGTWHEITLTPDTLARINANIVSRLFIQSHLGGSY